MLKRGRTGGGTAAGASAAAAPGSPGTPSLSAPASGRAKGSVHPTRTQSNTSPPQLQPHPPSTPKHHPPGTPFTDLGPRERNTGRRAVTVAKMRREAPAHPPTQQWFAPSLLEKPQLSQGLGLPDIMVSLKL